MPALEPGLYSIVIVLKGGRVALLVDRVSEVLPVDESALLPVGSEDSFNGCSEAVLSVGGQTIHLLSPEKILLEKERASISEFQAMEQQRLQDWEPAAQ